MSAIASNPTSRPVLSLTPKMQSAIQQDPLPAIRTIDLDEMRRLSAVARFYVLVPAPCDENGKHSSQASESDSFPELSASFNCLEIFKKTDVKTKDNYSDSEATVGDVKVNFATMEAHRWQEPIFLTALEFKTLKYLIVNARRVISRDELLNEVWGYHSYPSTRTVDNQVAKLRKKLEANPARPVHLRTVHGVGYKFLP
jgi:DNA-binding winged helix-turn-helix (wHTH) protein